MNFLEAYSALDSLSIELEENYDQSNIPWPFTCWNTGGVCPGCGGIHDKDKASYSKHLTSCTEFNNLMKGLEAEAIIKVGEKGHSFDHMQNISAVDLDNYMANRDSCEICGKTVERHPDHNHSNLKFRGALCTNCNLNLGWLDQYKSSIKSYLSRLQQWKKLHKYKKPTLGGKNIDAIHRKLLSTETCELIKQERAKNKPKLTNTSHNKNKRA